MKSLNGKICVGAPYSRVRYEDAGHICADCLEHKPNVAPDISYSAFCIGADQPAMIQTHCHVCEEHKRVVIVKPISAT